MAVLWKLLALVALLLTSFSMTSPVRAAPHHDMSAAMQMEHCPDAGGKSAPKGGVPECAMACSAALPAADVPQPQLPTVGCSPTHGPLARSLHGIHPDTATPPPKGS